MIKREDIINRYDEPITNWMARWSIPFLRISLGIVFLWFGVLKFFPGLSPAQGLAIRTIDTLTLGLLKEEFIIYTLAIWESLIGIGLIFKIYLRETLALLFLQMAGTITPVFIFPGEVFTQIPYGLTLEGQYIVKNIVVISAALTIGATVRGGRLVASSDENKQAPT
ncbi:MAG: DoxX family membrane protein [Bacteroidota bacterium]